MIIFGTRGITYSAGSGDFVCPACQSEMPYSHKRVRRFFTLYFIPLIPLDLHGEYVECQQCRGTYELEVLDYDPEAGAEQYRAEFHRAVMQVMVGMLLADGVVDDEEVQTIRDLYVKLTKTEISIDEVRAEISNAEQRQLSVTDTLAQISGALNDNGKEMVIKAAYLVAVADGEFQAEEKALIVDVGRSLGMTGAHLKGVVSDIQGG